jgi:hypothetical protein
MTAETPFPVAKLNVFSCGDSGEKGLKVTGMFKACTLVFIPKNCYKHISETHTDTNILFSSEDAWTGQINGRKGFH